MAGCLWHGLFFLVLLEMQLRSIIARDTDIQLFGEWPGETRSVISLSLASVTRLCTGCPVIPASMLLARNAKTEFPISYYNTGYRYKRTVLPSAVFQPALRDLHSLAMSP